MSNEAKFKSTMTSTDILARVLEERFDMAVCEKTENSLHCKHKKVGYIYFRANKNEENVLDFVYDEDLNHRLDGKNSAGEKVRMGNLANLYAAYELQSVYEEDNCVTSLTVSEVDGRQVINLEVQDAEYEMESAV